MDAPKLAHFMFFKTSQFFKLLSEPSWAELFFQGMASRAEPSFFEVMVSWVKPSFFAQKLEPKPSYAKVWLGSNTTKYPKALALVFYFYIPFMKKRKGNMYYNFSILNYYTE